MIFPPASLVQRVSAALLLTAGLGSSGCVVYHAVVTPVKVAATAVVVTGEATTAAVKATGKVAISTFNAAGNTSSAGIDAASRLTQTGMVTFVDISTGTVVRVPWQEGLTLAAAGANARVELARRGIDVVRAGSVVYSAARKIDRDTRLANGDVVRLRG